MNVLKGCKKVHQYLCLGNHADRAAQYSACRETSSNDGDPFSCAVKVVMPNGFSFHTARRFLTKSFAFQGMNRFRIGVLGVILAEIRVLLGSEYDVEVKVVAVVVWFRNGFVVWWFAAARVVVPVVVIFDESKKKKYLLS